MLQLLLACAGNVPRSVFVVVLSLFMVNVVFFLLPAQKQSWPSTVRVLCLAAA